MSVMAAIKAIPALVEGLKEIKQAILMIADKRTDAKIAEIQAELRAATAKFQLTENRDEMLKTIRDLSVATSR